MSNSTTFVGTKAATARLSRLKARQGWIGRLGGGGGLDRFALDGDDRLSDCGVGQSVQSVFVLRIAHDHGGCAGAAAAGE